MNFAPENKIITKKLCCFDEKVYLCSKVSNPPKMNSSMKKNITYPHIDEEDNNSPRVNEPVGALNYADTLFDNGVNNIPGLPQTWEELLEGMAEGEEEYERGDGIPWELATRQMKAHIREYGA